MHASLNSVAVVGVALFVGCSQPITPTSPTSLSSASLSIASSEAKVTGAGVLSNQEVPFKGRLEGTATITPGTPPFLSVLIEGTGNATHLGRFTVKIPHVVNAQQPERPRHADDDAEIDENALEPFRAVEANGGRPVPKTGGGDGPGPG